MLLHFHWKYIAELSKATIILNANTNFLLYGINCFELRSNADSFILSAYCKFNIGIKRKIPITECFINDGTNLTLPEKVCCIIRSEKTKLNRKACAKRPFPGVMHSNSR